MPIADTPFEQFVVAVATYCTVGLTVLLLAGAVTETLAVANVAKVTTRTGESRLRFFMQYSPACYLAKRRAKFGRTLSSEVLREISTAKTLQFRRATRSQTAKPSTPTKVAGV